MSTDKLFRVCPSNKLDENGKQDWTSHYVIAASFAEAERKYYEAFPGDVIGDISQEKGELIL